MAFFRTKNHPYDPGYAIPGAVLTEPPGRGTAVTKGYPRGTIDITKVGTGGYALPGFVLAETPGRGVYDTKMLPRRWVDMKAQDSFADQPRPQVRGSLSGTVFSRSSLSGSSLDSRGRSGRPVRDPFRNYGQKASATILARLAWLPAAQRPAALKEILAAVDSKLPGEVEKKAAKYRAEGAKPKAALKQALAASFSNGLVDEVMQFGKSGSPGPMLALGGFGGLGATGTPSIITIDVKGAQFPGVKQYPDGEMAWSKVYTGTGGISSLKIPSVFHQPFKTTYERMRSIGFSDLYGKGFMPLLRISDSHLFLIDVGTGNLDAINKTIKRAEIKLIKMAKKEGISGAVGDLVSLPFKIVSKVTSEVTKGLTSIAAPVLKSLGSLACAAVNSGAAPLAAAGAGMATGGETGAQIGITGAGIAQNMCGGGGGAVAPEPAKFPILPIAIAGAGAVLLILAVK